MPNIANVLKSEISRLARKEIRNETAPLRKAVTQYRGQIAQLKRRVQTLEAQLQRATRGRGRAAPAAAEGGDDAESGRKVRFSAKSLASQRKRLGLSAAALARLLGVSALSIYKWENGSTRPREKQVQAIAQLRGLGRREAQRRLAQAEEQG